MEQVEPTAPRAAGRLDRPPGQRAQDVLSLWPLGAPRRGRLRIRTLVTVRWLTVIGQTAAVLFVALVLKFPFPIGGCFALIGLSAIMNLIVMFSSSGQRQAADWEATSQIAFDILQLTGMLYLTGGAINPFSLLIIAPVTLAAATLPGRHVIFLVGMGVAAIIVLSINALPLPAAHAVPFQIPTINRVGNVVSRVLGLVFTAAYAWQAASEASRMELALDATNAVLAREQRLSALGGLAASAAHELGTPLATISIVAKEMAYAARKGPLREDAELLVSQAARCRDILRRLAADPESGDAVHARMTLGQLVQEASTIHAPRDGVEIVGSVTGPEGLAVPEIRRMPEVVHALTSIIENAADFAWTRVTIAARFDVDDIELEVRDDGPGFASDVLSKLGEPYVTSRPGGEGSPSGHIGMGLGFFIAKTLLERTGGDVSFRNGREGGARVIVRWARASIAAPPQEA